MTNFVLSGLPDFIIVGEPWQPSRPRPGSEPVYVTADFAEVLTLMGLRYGETEVKDRIIYSDSVDAALRKILDRFGFERRPNTFAELYGLFDYCDRLTAISGIGMIHANELRAWQAKSFLLLAAHQRPHVHAAKLFCVGDLDGLRRWHREPDAMLQIGAAYRRVA